MDSRPFGFAQGRPFAGYVISLGSDFTNVVVGHGLETCDTRGRDARDTVVFCTAKSVLRGNEKKRIDIRRRRASLLLRK